MQKKLPRPIEVGGSEVVTVGKKISSPSNEMLEKPRRIVICGVDQLHHVLKKDSIVDTVSAMEFCFLYSKWLILVALRAFFFYKRQIRHPLPKQGKSGGLSIVQRFKRSQN